MRAVHVAVPALLIAAAAAFSLGRSTESRTPAPQRSTTAEARTASPKHAAAEVQRRRYALDYRHQVSVDGSPIEPMWVKGTWTTEPLADGRLSVELSDARFGGKQEMPSPQEVTAPFQLAAERDGHLRLGFVPETSAPAKGLLATLACALWYSPGEGDQWTVEEEDRTGRYIANYERHGDEVIRRRVRYVALRDAGGLQQKHASRYTASGTTRYRLDAGGVTEVIVDEHLRMDMGKGAPKLEVHVQATLRLSASETRLARSADELLLEAPPTHRKPGKLSDLDAERERLGGAKLPDLLAKLDDIHAIEKGSKDEQPWRVESFMKLRALLRVDPGSTEAVRDALKARSGDDTRMVSVLAGALGDAGTKEATSALASLVSTDMPPVARMHVVGALGLSSAPSAESAAVLTATLDDATVGSMSALALGSQSGKLAASDPEAAQAAVRVLLQRSADATDPSQRLTYLQALANSGAPEAMPLIRAALAGNDVTLADAAAYGLRFIPGEEADELLHELIDGNSPDHIKVQAIRATEHRAPAVWEAPLQQALSRYGSNQAVQSAIRAVLATWAS